MQVLSHHATRRTARVRGMALWQPRAATLALLDTVRGILAEYERYLPLTLRQIFYRLVGAHDYPKDEKAYDRLGEMLNRARRGGYVEFDAIRDDGANIQTKMGWDSAADLIATWRNDVANFRLDREQNQPHRLLVVVEAAGMAPMVAALTAPYSIPVIASGGFDSTTAKYRLAVTLGEYDGLTEILHIGDLDPSGVHLFAALIRDSGLPVTPEQIGELQTAPGHPTPPGGLHAASRLARSMHDTWPRYGGVAGGFVTGSVAGIFLAGERLPTGAIALGVAVRADGCSVVLMPPAACLDASPPAAWPTWLGEETAQ